jgi:hypothetical protein
MMIPSRFDFIAHLIPSTFEAKGEHCLLAWPKVTRPKELGSLGISDLKNLGWALQVQWLWLKKSDPSKPWVSQSIQGNECVQALSQ